MTVSTAAANTQSTADTANSTANTANTTANSVKTDLANMNWPYVETQYLHCDYDEAMSIPNAYAYLKTLQQFEGVEDI